MSHFGTPPQLSAEERAFTTPGPGVDLRPLPSVPPRNVAAVKDGFSALKSRLRFFSVVLAFRSSFFFLSSLFPPCSSVEAASFVQCHSFFPVSLNTPFFFKSTAHHPLLDSSFFHNGQLSPHSLRPLSLLLILFVCFL